MTKGVRIACLAAIATIYLPALAQISANLTGPASGPVSDGIYISSYYATVGDVANRAVVRGDFDDDSYFNSTWNANVTSFSSITSSNRSRGLAKGGLWHTAENGGYTSSRFWNLPPDATGTLCKAEHRCGSQEFPTVSVPEGGSTITYLLLVGLCSGGAILLRSRRVVTRTIA
jgi:hypothetical protein